MKSTYNVEFAGNQIESKEVIARAKKVWVDAGNKNRKVKDLKQLPQVPFLAFYVPFLMYYLYIPQKQEK